MLNLQKWAKHSLFSKGYFLGAPTKDCLPSYETELVKRFGCECEIDGTVKSCSSATKKAYEMAFSYLDRIVDRQISKASGLLTFNSVLLVVLYSQGKPFEGATLLRLLLTTMLLLSCMLLLDMMLVVWSTSEVFGSASKDFEGSLQVCCTRTRYLSLSTVLALGAILLMLGVELRYCK